MGEKRNSTIRKFLPRGKRLPKKKKINSKAPPRAFPSLGPCRDVGWGSSARKRWEGKREKEE